MWDELLSDKACGFIQNTACVFCGSTDLKQFNVQFVEKHWKPFPKATNLRCQECLGQFNQNFPNSHLMSRLYREHYPAQSSGLTRFRMHFTVKVIDVPVLEVGPGDNGISDICKNGYYAAEVSRTASKFPVLFEDFTPEMIDEAKTLGIEVIVSCDCIEHMVRPMMLFDNAHAILPAGGLLYIHFGELHDPAAPQAMRQTPHINNPSWKSVEMMCDGKFEIIDRGSGSPHKSGWIFRRLSDVHP